MAVGGLSGGGITAATMGATSPTGPHFLRGPFFWAISQMGTFGTPLLVNKLMILALCEKAYASSSVLNVEFLVWAVFVVVDWSVAFRFRTGVLVSSERHFSGDSLLGTANIDALYPKTAVGKCGSMSSSGRLLYLFCKFIYLKYYFRWITNL